MTHGTMGAADIAALCDNMGERAEWFAYGWKCARPGEAAPMSTDFGSAYRARYAAYCAGQGSGHPSIDNAWDEYRKTGKVS